MPKRIPIKTAEYVAAKHDLKQVLLIGMGWRTGSYRHLWQNQGRLRKRCQGT